MERRQASKFYPHFNQEERPVIDYFTGLFNGSLSNGVDKSQLKIK